MFVSELCVCTCFFFLHKIEGFSQILTVAVICIASYGMRTSRASYKTLPPSEAFLSSVFCKLSVT